MGTNKPTDFGVKYTAADASSAKGKIGELLGGTSTKPVSVGITEAELTAILNEKSQQVETIPLKNSQVSVENGSIEISGSLDMERMRKLMESQRVSESTRKMFEAAAGVMKTDPSVLVKMEVEMIEGKPKLDVESFKIGQVLIPESQLGSSGEMIQSGLNEFMEKAGLTLTDIQASNGVLTLRGGSTPP
jgi:hypothetical protein